VSVSLPYAEPHFLADHKQICIWHPYIQGWSWAVNLGTGHITTLGCYQMR